MSEHSRFRTTAGAWALAAVVVALGLATGTTSGAAPFAPSGHTAPTDTALDAARALADGRPGTAIIAPAVIRELGYAPTLEHGLAAKASGDCSSPIPLPAEFEPACKVHDLGYDLLRVAHRHGAAIPTGLRADMDSLLARQMREACAGRTACTTMAVIAHAAVQLNTLRQGGGAPVAEALPW